MAKNAGRQKLAELKEMAEKTLDREGAPPSLDVSVTLTEQC